MIYYRRRRCFRARDDRVEGKNNRRGPTSLACARVDLTGSDIRMLRHYAPPVRPVHADIVAGRPGRGRREKRRLATAEKRYSTRTRLMMLSR